MDLSRDAYAVTIINSILGYFFLNSDNSSKPLESGSFISKIETKKEFFLRYSLAFFPLRACSTDNPALVKIFFKLAPKFLSSSIINTSFFLITFSPHFDFIQLYYQINNLIKFKMFKKTKRSTVI